MESANYLEYLFAAYTVFWLVISGYIYTIARKQKALEQELEAVKSEMQQ
ncbi:MAG TPA: CcmD family protein [Bacteroidetes bacterium]|nr:CcmD family protein [Bacteroidota bacterium]